MAFQDFLGGRRLSITDFTQVELSAISDICNPLFDFISTDPARVTVNSRPTTWNIHKSQLYICYIATKGINSPVFEKVAALHRLVSRILFLNDTTDSGWDINEPVVTEETLRIQNDIEGINSLIATKTFDYLDYPMFEKHVGIKNSIEFINNALIESTYRYKYMVTRDKADGYHSLGLNDIMRPLSSLITTAFSAAAPYVVLFQGLMLAIDDFSTPNGQTVLAERLAEYERLKIKITLETNEMISYQTRINDDGYDYDFVNLEVIKKGTKGVYPKPQTPATFTAKTNPDGTVTVENITIGDLIIIDSETGIEATATTFTSKALTDGLHKISVIGINQFSYADTLEVTTKVNVLSNPLAYVNNNKVLVFSIVFFLIFMYVLWKKGYFKR